MFEKTIFNDIGPIFMVLKQLNIEEIIQPSSLLFPVEITNVLCDILAKTVISSGEYLNPLKEVQQQGTMI